MSERIALCVLSLFLQHLLSNMIAKFLFLAYGTQGHGWPSNGTNGTNDMHDPFVLPPIGGAAFSSPPSAVAPRPATAGKLLHFIYSNKLLCSLSILDPWGMDSVKTSLPPQHTGGSDSGLKTRNLKTPEHFLGENSALVNLDNLMGPPKTSVAGMPPKCKYNI